jgi:hypothetical protein
MELKLKYLATCLSAQAQVEAPKDTTTTPEENSGNADNKKEEQSALKKKMYSLLYVVRNKINVGTMIKIIMLKVCVAIATINTEEQKSLGIAITINCMPQGCAKYAT